MENLFKDKSRIFCFTPEVMLATFLIEIALAIYVFVKYRLTIFGRITVMILLLLAGFQLAEYQICAGSNPVFWSRIGFIIITFLPVLALHLIALLTGKNHFLKIGYTLMLVYLVIFAFGEKAVSGAVCNGNYIIFNTAQELWWTYGLYYFGFLLFGIWEAVEGIISDIRNKIYYWIILGYMSFMLPLGIVYMAAPVVVWSGTASIMCGFAVIFAFILAFKIAPLYNKYYESGKRT